MPANGAPRWRRWRGARAQLFAEGRPCATASAAGCAGSCALTWLGGTRILDRLERVGLRRVRGTGRRSAPRRCPARLWRDGAVDRRPDRLHTWLATPTSTTRSSCCPPTSGSAIVAVWDFCRAVDDAVDEARRAGARKRRPRADRAGGGRSSRAASSGGTPETPQGRALAPLVARVQSAAAPVRALIEGVEMDLGTAATRRSRTLRVLHPRGVGGRLICLRSSATRDAARGAIRHRPRGGAAADQHPARRARGSGAAASTFRTRTCARTAAPRPTPRRDGARRGRRASPAVKALLRQQARAGARLLRAGPRARCRGRRAPPRRRRDHGGHLPRAPRRIERARLRRLLARRPRAPARGARRSPRRRGSKTVLPAR